MSPRMGSQFSRFGCRESPYFSTTSGVSFTSGSVSSSPVTRSMLAWMLTNSAMYSATSCTGSKMPTA